MAIFALALPLSLLVGALADSAVDAAARLFTRPSLSTSRHEPLQVLGRTGYVYRPAWLKLTNTFAPPPAVVLVLHGSEEVANDMFGVGLEAIADARGDFMVAYPEMAQPGGENWDYNADLPYFLALVARLQQPDFGADASRLFICGHSAGGSMTLYLQNELDVFAAVGVVEAAVGHLNLWNFKKRGVRTMIVWNHADPVLNDKDYTPPGGETAYLDLTVSTLRRALNGTASPRPSSLRILPGTQVVPQAELLTFAAAAGAPEVRVLGFSSIPGRHMWAQASWTGSIDASVELTRFFMGEFPNWTVRRDYLLIVCAVLLALLGALLIRSIFLSCGRGQGPSALLFNSWARFVKRSKDLPAFFSPGSDWTVGKRVRCSTPVTGLSKCVAKSNKVFESSTLNDALLVV